MAAVLGSEVEGAEVGVEGEMVVYFIIDIFVRMLNCIGLLNIPNS